MFTSLSSTHTRFIVDSRSTGNCSTYGARGIAESALARAVSGLQHAGLQAATQGTSCVAILVSFCMHELKNATVYFIACIQSNQHKYTCLLPKIGGGEESKARRMSKNGGEQSEHGGEGSEARMGESRSCMKERRGEESDAVSTEG